MDASLFSAPLTNPLLESSKTEPFIPSLMSSEKAESIGICLVCFFKALYSTGKGESPAVQPSP